jgi:predicted HicB family RNase H-like nuclease
VTGIVLEHGGYIAKVTYDAGDLDMHGVVLNAAATLHFAGRSIDELQQAFADTIADYQAWCSERGKEPERPYSGNLPLRIRPELHRALALAAARAGKSINGYLAGLIERDTDVRSFK